jgi:hypothetical protein
MFIYVAIRRGSQDFDPEIMATRPNLINPTIIDMQEPAVQMVFPLVLPFNREYTRDNKL